MNKIDVAGMRGQALRGEAPPPEAVTVLLDIVEALLAYKRQRDNLGALLLLSGRCCEFPGTIFQRGVLELRLDEVIGLLHEHIALPAASRPALLPQARQAGLEPAAFLDAVAGYRITSWGPPLVDQEGVAWEYRAGRFWATGPEEPGENN